MVIRNTTDEGDTQEEFGNACRAIESFLAKDSVLIRELIRRTPFIVAYLDAPAEGKQRH